MKYVFYRRHFDWYEMKTNNLLERGNIDIKTRWINHSKKIKIKNDYTKI